MIDLHLHLDGSVSSEIIVKIALKEHTELPTYDASQLSSFLKCPKHCDSLNEYLTKFALPGQVMQTKYGLYEVTYDLIHRLDQQGILYAEIRFAPQLHTHQGLTQKEVIEAVLEGVKQGMKDFHIRVQIILCCMRGQDNHEENLETVRLAKVFLHQGVCALDLAGAEALYPTSSFQNEFALAKKLDIPFTIHAGEADSARSIREAISFGAQRIGHGIHAQDDPELMALLAEKKIGLEMCPTSNLQTKAIQTLDEYPLHTFLKQGILATINTDNTTVSDTTLKQEFELLETEYQLTQEEKKQLYQNAIEIAFLSPKEKEQLRKEMKL